jgi:hypothetical protein
MNKSFLLAFAFLLSGEAAADKKDKPDKKIEPLSEAFLLFLAEMEEVDGDLIHPVDLTETDAKQTNKKQLETQKREKLNKDNGTKDDGK